MIRESGRINRNMFQLICDKGRQGKSELELAGIAEEASRSAGFGGRMMMAHDCDRVVIASGRSEEFRLILMQHLEEQEGAQLSIGSWIQNKGK